MSHFKRLNVSLISQKGWHNIGCNNTTMRARSFYAALDTLAHMHQIGYDMKRRSCHLVEIGTLAIHPLTLHDEFLATVFSLDKT